MKPERRRPFPERRRLNREGIVSENLESLRLELSGNCIDGLLSCLIGIIGGDRSILLIDEYCPLLDETCISVDC